MFVNRKNISVLEHAPTQSYRSSVIKNTNVTEILSILLADADSLQLFNFFVLSLKQFIF